MPIRTSLRLVVFLLTLASFCEAGVNTTSRIEEIIISDPPWADIYWGKSRQELVGPVGKTPHSRSMTGVKWEPFCYQVKKAGYHDSQIICKAGEKGDRYVHFNLKPLKLTVTSNPEGAGIYWGSSRDALKSTGFKTPHTDTDSDRGANWKSWYFQVKRAGYKDSEVAFRPRSDHDRRIHFVLTPLDRFKPQIAEALIKQGDYEKALTYYHGRLKSHGGDARLFFLLSYCYFKLEDWPQAELWLKKALKKDPRSVPSHYNMALIHINLGEYKGALSSFKKVLALSPGAERITPWIRVLEGIVKGRYFPERLRELAGHEDQTGLAARLILWVQGYNRASDLWIEGTAETKATSREILGKTIYLTYHVSPKIFESLEYFRKLKAQIQGLTISKGEIESIKSLFQTAVHLRIAGTELYAGAFYIKASQYKGEAEKGLGKIRTANRYLIDGLRRLRGEVVKEADTFGDVALTRLDLYLTYYQAWLAG